MDRQEISKVVEQVVKEVKSSSMTLSMAKELISGIEEKAGQMGMSVVIAVVDKGQGPLPSTVWTGPISPAMTLLLTRLSLRQVLKCPRRNFPG